jgi:hypothetical protein
MAVKKQKNKEDRARTKVKGRWVRVISATGKGRMVFRPENGKA